MKLFKYIVIRNTIVKLTGIALLFILVKTKNDVAIYIAIMAATGLLGNISMWTYLPKFLKKVDIRRLRPFRHFKQTFAYFIPTIATSVYTVLDKTMIGVITKSSDQNGYYEQATKIVRMIQSLLFSLNTVMTSRQSYLFAEKKYDEIKDKINKSFDYLFGIAIAAMFGLQGIAANFVPCLLVPAAIAACVAGFDFFKKTHTIDLNQYQTISYQGYNRYAAAELNLDAKALERDYGDKISMPQWDRLQEKSKTEGVSDAVASFCQRYTSFPDGGYLDPDTGLANGNSVQYYGADRAEYDDDFHCWVKSESFKTTVKGAESITDADPFKGLRIVTTGGNSEAVAEVNTDKMPEPFCYIDFQLSQSTYLSNGDTIRVTIPESDLKWLADENDGYVPKKDAKDYVVKDLPMLTSSNAESTRQAEHEQYLREQQAKKAAAERAAEEDAAARDSHSSHSGTGNNTGSGDSYDDDVDPDDPDYEEGDEDFDEYDDIEYYDDDWEGDY